MSTEPSGAIKFPAVETWKDQYSVAKTQTFYVCQNCGKKSLRYMGKCPACGEWNTMQEEVEQRDSPAVARNIAPSGLRSAPERLKDVSTEHNPRWQVQVEEFSRVLGGGIVPGSIILLGGEPGIGKCVTGGTRIIDPVSGAYFPITEWENNGYSVLSVDTQTYRVGADAVTGFYDRGVQPIVEIRTKLGRVLRCTPSHPVLTPDGWQPVGKLSAGRAIAAPRALPYFGDRPLPEVQVKLIAYILSDGSASSKISVTSELPEVAVDMRGIAEAFW